MIGSSVSHYKILEKLGEGGMGVVYRAHDTKLERDVALKFLPAHLSASEADKARFIQEAKAAATLNHPNICTIHAIEEHEGQLFIAMQYVDGQLLRDRMAGMTQKQALEIGIQVAEGLSAAHERGVVHRDIKPENIMIRRDGIAQIMDFGLAKLKGVSRLTKEGSTVGTAGYMSPEQVQGQDADHRSDIFSLGVLLYEMLTGELPFKGVHETAIAYEIVNVDAPPMAALKPEINPELDAIILECLEKDPAERTQASGQVAVDLKRYRRESSRQKASRITAARPVLKQSISGSGQLAGQESTGRVGISYPVAAAGIILALLAGFGLSSLLTPSAPDMALIHASIKMPEGVRYASGLGGNSAISPDGSMVAFCGVDSLEKRRLYLRRMDSGDSKQMTGTEDATYPFWSPDSRSIGFFAEGKVKAIDAGGGPVLTIADAPFGRGGAWSTRGEILYSPSVTDPNLLVVPATGGTPRQVTSFHTTGMVPRFPSFLPDGNHFLFSLLELRDGAADGQADAYVGSMDGDSLQLLVDDSHCVTYRSGFIFFLRQGILMSQGFDPDALSLTGKPFPLQGNINSWTPRSRADYSVSESGILLFSAGRGEQSAAGELSWVGVDGSERYFLKTSVFTRPVLSPDGRKVAYDMIDDQAQISNIWIYDLVRKVRTRVTFGPTAGAAPAWSRDGQTIFYNAEVNGSKANILAKRADGTEEADRIAVDPEGLVGYYPIEVSPDGRHLLIRVTNESMSELGTIDLRETARPLPISMLGIKGFGGGFSPDGNWIVYQTSFTGSSMIYVTSFGGVAGKWQLTAEGGDPRWLNGSIVYFSGVTNRYERVSVSFIDGSPVFSEPASLFPGGGFATASIHGFSQKENAFLAYNQGRAGSSAGLSMVVNWQKMMVE